MAMHSSTQDPGSGSLAETLTGSVGNAESIVWRDRLGICLSVLCLAHCILTPFVMSLIPVGVALGFWHSGLHQIFLVAVPVVALLAFVPGWRVHRDSRVWYWSVGGIFCLAFGVFMEPSDSAGLFEVILKTTVPTMIGGGCLIRAHVLNRQLCQCCAHDHTLENAPKNADPKVTAPKVIN